MTYNLQNNQQRQREAHSIRQVATQIQRIVPSARSGALRLGLLLLCLCALVLSGCGQNTRSAPAQGTQQQAPGSSLTYVAIGASDTFGIGTDDPYDQNWPTDLAKMLNQPVHLINLGIPGMTLHDALTSELPIALDAHPALVTVWLAVNDLAANVPVDSYQHDLNTLLNRLHAAAPRARIAVGNMPDLSSVPFFSHTNSVTLSRQTAAYNAAIASTVMSHHAILVDLSGQGYNLQTHPEYISSDGLHPSSIGYVKVAMIFYDALQRA